MSEGKTILRRFDDLLENFALDVDTFGNRLMKWQLMGLRLCGYIYDNRSSLPSFHFLRGLVVTFSLFIIISAQAISAWFHLYDFDNLALILGYFTNCSTLLWKAIAFYWYRKEYQILLNSTRTGVEKVLQTSLPAELKIYNHYIKYITRMDFIIRVPPSLNICYLWAETTYFLVCQWEGLFHQHDMAQNGTITLARIYDMYPLGYLTGNFFIVYISPFYLSAVAITSLIIWHTFNATLMRYASFRLDVLSYKIENMLEYIDILHVDGIEYDGTRKFQQSYNQRLRLVFTSCIEDFAEIRFFVKTYESVSNVVLFIESSTMSLILCILLFVILKDFTSGNGIYELWLFFNLGILWLYYWHANEISVKSNAITNALYAFPWYDCSLSLQKDVAMFMQLTNRPIVMKTGFVRMNTETLVTILKTSYSYFTLLQNFTN